MSVIAMSDEVVPMRRFGHVSWREMRCLSREMIVSMREPLTRP